jgi:hypothetical protein
VCESYAQSMANSGGQVKQFRIVLIFEGKPTQGSWKSGAVDYVTIGDCNARGPG